MPAINHQVDSPNPEVTLSAIHIPDEADLGTGTFTTVLAPNALKARKAIASIILNPPVFQISSTVNPNGDVIVLLGAADGSDPSDRKTFLLSRVPGAIKLADTHEIRVSFIRWNITGAFFDNALMASAKTMD
mgnify:FL=1